MTQITYRAYSKYDLALLFTLLVTIDDYMASLETENAQLIQLRTDLHRCRQRYDTAYKQSTKSFLTEQIAAKDEARDKVTLVIEWVARYWAELPDDEDAIRGRRVWQPFKDLDYIRHEALLAQNAKWTNIAQVLAAEPQATDVTTMGLAPLVQKANVLTNEIASLILQRQEEQSSYVVGEMRAARDESEAKLAELIQYYNALLIINPDAALEETATYIQQAFNKAESQYLQGRKHATDETPDGDTTPVEPDNGEES